MMLSRVNHDVRGKDSQFLEDYLTGPDGLYHYGFRQGPLASIVLDSGEDKPDDNEEYGGLANFSARSEEHTSELQSRGHLVCRLLLEKKKTEGQDRNKI